MSKVIRINDETEKLIKYWKQATEGELLIEDDPKRRQFVKEVKEKDAYAIETALVCAIDGQVKYIRSKGIDFVIKKE